jgi:hypothetical protein
MILCRLQPAADSYVNLTDGRECLTMSTGFRSKDENADRH